MSQSGMLYETVVYIPPTLTNGDCLTPIQFEMLDGSKKFTLFGRYNEEKDTMEYALSGSPGSSFKMSISDGNSPYGWKIKKHGVTKGDHSGEGEMSGDDEGSDAEPTTRRSSAAMKLFQDMKYAKQNQLTKKRKGLMKRTDCGYPQVDLKKYEKSTVDRKSLKKYEKTYKDINAGSGSDDEGHSEDMEGMEGMEDEGSEAEEGMLVYESIFQEEDVIAVPHASMRASKHRGIIDARDECVMPWSFYGPSLPEVLFTNRIKVKLLKDDAPSEGEGGSSQGGNSESERNQAMMMTLMDFNQDGPEAAVGEDVESSKSSKHASFEEGSVDDGIYADDKRAPASPSLGNIDLLTMSRHLKVQELVQNLKNLSSEEDNESSHEGNLMPYRL